MQSWDQFLNIRIGARLIKNTGDEYQKTSDHVYEKVNRYYLSNEDIEGKFVELDKTNILTKPQFITAEPTEPYHITNKEYVDALVATAAVDLSGFARLDVENSWLKPQLCNAEPKFRTHLTNKGYVDDRINGIEFDTTALAKLNNPNVFTAPQSVTVPAIAPEHLVTKQYVDDTKEYLVNNFSGFVRADLPNTYTATQDFQFKITVPYPKVDLDAANKLYVDTKVKETQQSLGNFAALDLENIFEKDQTFRKAAICSSTPSMPYHLANKEYVDSVASSGTVPDGIAFVDQDNVWVVKQNFGSGLTTPPPEEARDCANKEYVDAQIHAAEVPMASDTIAGRVKLTNTDITAEDFAKSNDVSTSAGVARYVVTQIPDTSVHPTLAGDNTFTRENRFRLGIISEGDILVTNHPGSVKIGGGYMDNDRILFDYIEPEPENPDIPDSPLMPPLEERFPISTTEPSYLMDVKISQDTGVIHGGRVNVISGGFAAIDMVVFPEITSTPSVSFDNTRLGVTELDTGSYVIGNTTYLGVMILDTDETPPEYAIDPLGIPAYIGLKVIPDDKIYPCSNMTPDPDSIEDELLNANWVIRSPYLVKKLDAIVIDVTGFDHKKMPANASAYYELRRFTENGIAKVKDTSLNFVLGLLSNQVTVTMAAKGKTLTLSDADIILKDINETTLDVVNCRVRLERFSGTINADNTEITSVDASGVLKATDSKVRLEKFVGDIEMINTEAIVANVDGTLNASRKSHAKLVKDSDLSKLKINASIYSTVDNIDNTCSIVLDESSVQFLQPLEP